MSEASAAVSPARAARISAPRRKPVNRSTLAEREVLTLRLLELPLVSWPVIGSIREVPSEKKSLADELADTVGRKAPQAALPWAPAVLTPAAARTTSGCTRSESRMASASVTEGWSGAAGGGLCGHRPGFPTLMCRRAAIRK